MPAPSVQLSCVLLTWNSSRYVAHCLASLFEDLDASGLSYEVLVVDNGSTDGTLGILQDFQRQRATLLTIPLGHNTGTTFSRNIALRMCRGQYIAVLDSDIQIHQPGTFRALVDFLAVHPDVGLVAPRLQFPSGRHQKTVDAYPTLTHKFKRFFFLRDMEAGEADLAQATAPQDIDYAVSAFWVMPAHLPQRIGLLDEAIFYAPEDVDYCLRAALAGARLVYLPALVATHHAQEISRRSFLSRSFREHLKGLAYFYRKHGFVFSLARVNRAIHAARQRGDWTSRS